MNSSQVATTINLIIEDYSMLKPDDFKLCFKRAMRGHYGKVYDRIDGELIFEWLEQYLYERDSEIEILRKNENARLKKQSNFRIGQDAGQVNSEEEDDKNKPVPMPEWFKMPEKKQAEIKPMPARRQTEDQMFYNSLINRFEEAYKVRGQEKGGRRFVKFYGRFMNVEEYLNHKSKQVERLLRLVRRSA